MLIEGKTLRFIIAINIIEFLIENDFYAKFMSMLFVANTFCVVISSK